MTVWSCSCSIGTRTTWAWISKRTPLRCGSSRALAGGASPELLRCRRRQSLDDQPGQAFRLGLARGAVAELRHRYAEAEAVLARRHAVAPPKGVVGADRNGNRLGIDVVLAERLLEVVQEFAG